MRGVYLLVGERLHQVSERVVWAPLRPRTDARLQSKTWRLLLDRDSIEELSKGRSARYIRNIYIYIFLALKKSFIVTIISLLLFIYI